MRQEWSIDELVSAWTLVEADWPLVGNKTGATRLGFALLLKFFEIDARFPQHPGEVPAAAVSYGGEQVKVDPGEFGTYRWSGRTIEYDRAQIRDAFGFREFTRGDEDKLAGWLAEEVCPVELCDEALLEPEASAIGREGRGYWRSSRPTRGRWSWTRCCARWTSLAR